MVYGLTIGTERAITLQQSIQDELMNRGYSPDADPVMAEYITIMVINNKTAAQITSELEDLIGTEYNPSFTDWLFQEAAKGASGPEISPQTLPPHAEQLDEIAPMPDAAAGVPNDSSRPAPNASRNGVYQQAISQALPASSSSAQKRTASARSPSPSHPNKSRRTDLPTGPRAMYRDGPSGGAPHSSSRNLLDRISGPPSGRPGPRSFQRDEIQARIDNIVGNSPDAAMMMQQGFPGMGMDMNALAAANMANPIMLQEMMMNQMALMAQMASSMGIINPNTGQFAGPGYPMQPGMMAADMSMMQNGVSNGFPPQQVSPNPPIHAASRGRGASRGGRSAGRGRGGGVGPGVPNTSSAKPGNDESGDTSARTQAPVVISPTPIIATLSPTPTTSVPPTQSPAFAIPERPQSPTLCKFALKCTNVHCRYSHPSPVATVESGVVLSNEACEKGKDCKDKDCIKAHVSPAVLNPQAEQQPIPNAINATPHSHHTAVLCRFGAACTRPGCTFNHPPRVTHNNHFAQQCRFGAACTRAQCPFQHPEGRVLPSSFHRGIATTGGMINVPTPEPGSMGGPSPHKSVTFNNPTAASVREKLEKQMKEIQDKKDEVEKAVKNAEAAANKKEDVKPVPIAA